jgi:hypothetical protein
MTWRHKIDTVAKLPSGNNKYFAASKERTFKEQLVWKLRLGKIHYFLWRRTFVELPAAHEYSHLLPHLKTRDWTILSISWSLLVLRTTLLLLLLLLHVWLPHPKGVFLSKFPTKILHVQSNPNKAPPSVRTHNRVRTEIHVMEYLDWESFSILVYY